MDPDPHFFESLNPRPDPVVQIEVVLFDILYFSLRKNTVFLFKPVKKDTKIKDEFLIVGKMRHSEFHASKWIFDSAGFRSA